MFLTCRRHRGVWLRQCSSHFAFHTVILFFTVVLVTGLPHSQLSSFNLRLLSLSPGPYYIISCLFRPNICEYCPFLLPKLFNKIAAVTYCGRLKKEYVYTTYRARIMTFITFIFNSIYCSEKTHSGRITNLQ